MGDGENVYTITDQDANPVDLLFINSYFGNFIKTI